MTRRVLIVMGTRPEAIKLAPVYLALAADPAFAPITLATGQHDSLFADALSAFDMPIDHALQLDRSGRSLLEASGDMLCALQPVLDAARPDCVIVQGDTLTTFLGAFAGFYSRIPVAHVEAGLRTGDMRHPFPEEANRCLVGRVADLHFAPTPRARDNLLAEGIAAQRVHLTGNTAIDALNHVIGGRAPDFAAALPPAAQAALDGEYVLVTLHRRESFGAPLQAMLDALVGFAAAHPELALVFPVHPNPAVREQVMPCLGTLPNVHLVDPLGYVDFAHLLRGCVFAITDSGGIQEEAPALRKPVLVLREKTEREESVECGAAWLAGNADRARIARLAGDMLDRARSGGFNIAGSPYGGGDAAQRIAAALRNHLGPF